MEKFITRDDFRKGVTDYIRENRDTGGKKPEECVSEHEDAIDGGYYLYTNEERASESLKDMTYEAYTRANIVATANCISMFY